MWVKKKARSSKNEHRAKKIIIVHIISQSILSPRRSIESNIGRSPGFPPKADYSCGSAPELNGIPIFIPIFISGHQHWYGKEQRENVYSKNVKKSDLL